MLKKSLVALVHSRAGIVGSLGLLLAIVVGCVPAALGTGLAELAEGNTTRVVILVFVNQTGEPVQLQLTGDQRSGGVISLPPGLVPPGATIELAVRDPRCVRVRACEMTRDPGRAPLTWDYDIEPPDDSAIKTVCTLDREASVLSALRSNGGTPEQIDLQRLVSDGSSPQFEAIARSDLDAAPERVVLHASGGYLYTLVDLGSEHAEIRAYRIDAETGGLELIGPEFGSQPVNPRQISYAGDFGDVDLFVEPLGRIAYVVDRDPAAFRSTLRAFPTLADGSLGNPATSTRGLIGDLEFRRDGQFAVLSENFGLDFAARVLQLGPDGLLGSLVAEARMPCVESEGGAVALHPSGGFVYVALRDDPSDRVKVGAYLFGASGEFIQVSSECSDFVTIDDLTFDPDGEFLYITGTNVNADLAVIRYSLNAVTGALDSIVDNQILGQVSNLTATVASARPANDPLRNVVYVAIDDTLVPHVPGSGGQLEVVDPGLSLPYGSNASTRLVTGTQRGTVQISLR